MNKIFQIIWTLFFPKMTYGQHVTLDQKVQQLFFNVDLSNQSPSLVDSFANIKGITYQKPNKYGVHRLTGIDWTHSFIFTYHPDMTKHFDTGVVEIKIREHNNVRRVLSISWILRFNKLEDAKNVFDELTKSFSQTKAIDTIYTSDSALETAEFADKTAKKYPYVMFTLFDNNNLYKQYQIVFVFGQRSIQ